MKPSSTIIYFLEATPHHVQQCNKCHSIKYPGVRYSYKLNGDFDLCERCYRDFRFAPSTDYMTNRKNPYKLTTHEPKSK